MNEKGLDILGWLTFILLVVSGCYVAFRVPIVTYQGIPEGLRLVLNIEIVGLLIATTLEVFSDIAKLPDPSVNGITAAFKHLLGGKEPAKGGLAGAN